MTVWIIGDFPEKKRQWGQLLSNAMPSITIKTCSETSLNLKSALSIDALTQNDMVICLTSRLDSSIRTTIDFALASHIPVLCIVDNIEEELYETLIHMGVKGILDGNRTSLHTLKNAMRVINGGGIYIESSMNSNKVYVQNAIILATKPKLDITEWGIFSLLSKGFTTTEISEQLDTSVAKIQEYQLNIIEKTKSKTISGAVSTGITRGWISID